MMYINKKNQKGAVIPLIAISLIMIVSMVALVVDFGALNITHSDMRDTARAAAIAALEVYVEDINERIALAGTAPVAGEPNQIYRDALATAATRASAVANLNLSASSSSNLREGDLANYSDIRSRGNNSSNTGTGGFIQPGRWHFIESSSGIRPPCLAPGEPFKPCFEVLDDNVAANAMRVVITDDGGAVRSFFSEAAGFTRQNVSASGSAAFVPRQGVVAFDLSSSVTRDTHLNVDSSQGRSSEYAFYIDPRETELTNPANPESARVPPSCIGNSWQNDLISSQQSTWDAMLEAPTGGNGPQEHYRNDYRCLQISVEEEDGTADEYFAIETQGAPDVEPLNSIIEGTNFLLQSFADRRVVGDRVGAFGFDFNVLPQRRLPREPIGDLLLAEPIAEEQEFQDFLNATDTSIPITDDRRKDKFLFPRALVGTPGGGRRRVAYTKLQTALDHSMEMLQSSNTFDISDNFILLITDGITNCVGDPNNSPFPPADIDNDGDLDPITCFSSNNASSWPDNELFIRAGFEEIFSVEDSGELSGQTRKIADEGVRIHVALIGDLVGTHSLVRKSNSNGCLSFDEATAEGLSITNPINDPPYNPANGGSFFFPNNFSSVSAATGGIWWPILKPCSDPNFTPDILTNICNDYVPVDGDDGVISLSVADSLGHFGTGPNAITLQDDEWDEQGRLLCDPSGGTVAEQLRELIGRIMSDSPIVLVE